MEKQLVHIELPAANQQSVALVMLLSLATEATTITTLMHQRAEIMMTRNG
jgi:hypothetical protein